MSTETGDARPWLTLGAVSGALTVGLGAFAAHGLRGRLTEQMLGVFEKGVDYLGFHALGLLAVGLLLTVRPGIVLFSGSLFALALTGIGWLGAITPLGGTAFLIGWILLAAGAWQAPH